MLDASTTGLKVNFSHFIGDKVTKISNKLCLRGLIRFVLLRELHYKKTLLTFYTQVAVSYTHLDVYKRQPIQTRTHKKYASIT